MSEDARGRLIELRALSEKAGAGDKEARKELRRLVRASSPEVIAEASGIARRAEWMLVKTISAGKPLMEEALQERMHQMRSQIAGENPTPLEVLLTERVVARWLLVEVLEGLIAAQYQRDVKAHRVAPTYVIQQSRIVESRHKALPRSHQGACQGEEAAGGRAGAGEHAGECSAGLACNGLDGA